MSSKNELRVRVGSGWAMLALGVVFAACMPVFLIAVNVVYVTDSDWLYTYNWWRNGVPDRTGLPINELDSAADQIKDYFANDAERLDATVNTSRGRVSLFVEREVLHMIDVKELMRLVASVSIWSGLVLVVCVMLGFLVRRGANFHFDVEVAPLVRSSLGRSRWGHPRGVDHRFHLGIHPVPPFELCQRPLATGPISPLPTAFVP